MEEKASQTILSGVLSAKRERTFGVYLKQGKEPNLRAELSSFEHHESQRFWYSLETHDEAVISL